MAWNNPRRDKSNRRRKVTRVKYGGTTRKGKGGLLGVVTGTSSPGLGNRRGKHRRRK
jgi:hypothetical protein